MFTLCRGGERKGGKEEGRKYIYAWVLFFGTTACLLEQCVTTDFALSLVWEHWHSKCEGTKGEPMGFIPPQSCSTWLHSIFILDKHFIWTSIYNGKILHNVNPYLLLKIFHRSNIIVSYISVKPKLARVEQLLMLKHNVSPSVDILHHSKDTCLGTFPGQLCSLPLPFSPHSN